MSEELIQRELLSSPEKIGEWDYYSIGSTTLNELKKAKIIPNRDYGELASKKPDALITKKQYVIALIEFKQPKELNTEKKIRDAVKQEIEVAKAIKAKIYIVTDTTKTFWYNPLTGEQITDERGAPLTTVFNKSNPSVPGLIKKILASISATNSQIKPVTTVDPLPLAEKVWQDLWAVSGATPENCLYSFVEIFIFKYLSDLGVLSGIYSFDHLMQQYSTNNVNEVLGVYATIIRTKIKELFPGNPVDKTTIINGTIFVSKDDKAVSGYGTVFQKILKRFQSFGTLENIDFDFKSKLFETFLKESISKKNWGQYFTPLKVVRAIVKMVEIKEGMKICDPACGVGKFLLEPVARDLNKYYDVQKNVLQAKISLSGFDKGFDKDEQKTIILAKANMLIYMSNLIKENPQITPQFAQLFNSTFTLQTNSILGTLSHPVKDEYDLILTNPPYVMSGSSNLKDEISKDTDLQKYFSVNAMGIEGLFMEWIVRALKPGGKAFVVVPDGIMNRANDKKLRSFILQECYLDLVISLPPDTFFTTNKKTYIVALTKKHDSNHIQENPVMTYLCSEIGETRDVYRFEISENHLDDAVTLFNMFKGAKDSFRTTDARCKIVPIESFYNETHWSVDRWWTQQEKIDLGIEDEVDTVDLQQFITLISDVSATISEYQEPLSELEKKKNNRRKLKTISLADNDFFEIVHSNIGKNKTILTSLNTHDSTDIPVYTASKEPIAFIKEIQGKDPISASTDNPVLSFASNGDGSAGRNFVLHTTPFYINADRIGVRSKNADISLDYVRYALRNMKEEYQFNHNFKANKQNIKIVSVLLPIDDSGRFDFEEQENIANIVSYITRLHEYIDTQIKRISKININISNPHTQEFIEIALKDKRYFDLCIGDRMLKKDFINKGGNIPVYSANVFVPFGFLEETNIKDFTTPFVIWGIDGNFDFNVMNSGEQFATTDHCGAIQIKNSCIEPYYLLYELTLAKERYGFDRGLRASLKNVKEIIIRLPVDETGELDCGYMKEIAQQYKFIEQCKTDIIQQLYRLKGAIIEI